MKNKWAGLNREVCGGHVSVRGGNGYVGTLTVSWECSLPPQWERV